MELLPLSLAMITIITITITMMMVLHLKIISSNNKLYHLNLVSSKLLLLKFRT